MLEQQFVSEKLISLGNMSYSLKEFCPLIKQERLQPPRPKISSAKESDNTLIYFWSNGVYLCAVRPKNHNEIQNGPSSTLYLPAKS